MRYIRLRVGSVYIKIVFILYMAVCTYMLFFSSLAGRNQLRGRIQPVPFRTIREQFNFNYGVDIFILNILGNLFLFFPAGFFIALLSRSRKVIPFILVAAGCITAVEFSQYLFNVGCMDVDDIWMNLTGCLLGFFLGNYLAADDCLERM